MFILSFGKMFADHDVSLYTILDPERRRRRSPILGMASPFFR
ncbi:MAG: hypothetical protein ACP5UZ_03860 [Thermoplasmata archaeon]